MGLMTLHHLFIDREERAQARPVGIFKNFLFVPPSTTDVVRPPFFKHSRTSFEKNCFSAWASTLNMGLINKVDMVCLSPVGYGV